MSIAKLFSMTRKGRIYLRKTSILIQSTKAYFVNRHDKTKKEMLSMEKQFVTYQKAFDEGTIRKGHYFLVRYPNGKEALFRLVKREKGYVMCGPPTEGKISLKGKEGYDNFFDLANEQVKKEYSSKGVFKEIHALGGPKKDYEVHSTQEYRKVRDEIQEYLKDLGNIDENYFLASRCVSLNSSGALFDVFFVIGGYVHSSWWYYSHGLTSSPTHAVRPEATPESTLLLKTTGCDGSEEKPWICIGSEEEKSTRGEEEAVSDCTTGKGKASVSKDELMCLIQEGEAWIAKLKEYVSKLE